MTVKPMALETADKAKETIYIIDGSSVFYRAFHAIPASFTTSGGMLTNAVYGFTQTLRKIIKDFKARYIAVAFDVKGPSFRHEIFTEYKAPRPPMPDGLSVQVPYIKRIVKAFNIKAIEMPTFEADDVMATLTAKCEGTGLRVALVTGDKDMYQLVGENVFILDYNSGKECGPSGVIEKFGVAPGLIRDLLGLAGDASDNIPGVPGIGYKTAAKLLNKYGSLEGIYEKIDDVSGEKLKENLLANREQAFLSRELATLHQQVPVECDLDSLEFRGPDLAELEPLLRELDFKKILAEVVSDQPVKADLESEFTVIADSASLNAALQGSRRISITTATHEKSGVTCVHIGIVNDAGKAYAVDLEISSSCASVDRLPDRDIMNALRPYLESTEIKKDTDDAKALYLLFGAARISLSGVGMDTSLASYLIDPLRPDHSIESLAFDHLGQSHATGQKGVVDEGHLNTAVVNKASNIHGLAEILYEKLEADGLLQLYRDMELPLARVLACMERTGIRVDAQVLRGLSREIEVELADLERRIYQSAGSTFNINSPKQLSEVLFERLGLKPVKKTKTGYSTDEEVLTALGALHEVPAMIISFRGLSKLKSTYLDALIEIINPATGRVHTSFNQTVTATGRLSSSRPNLQNIPVRGEAALRIREAFVPDEGYSFLCADYSQIELRIVAHMSNDPVLIDAFRSGEDIHTRTASEVFGVLPGLITPELRRRAKAINFGIIYGMGPYGLSTELGITVKEATEYISLYFDRYRDVKRFMDTAVSEAISTGCTKTLFGRRRFIPELKSPVEATRRFGERLAINTPIQGTAADMIKAAMISIDKRLSTEGFKSRMLLQIHDELVFEALSSEKEALSSLVSREMEGVISLKVPVVVNLKSGPNWRSVE